MTSTDYDLPIDWPVMSAEQRHAWLCAERARRQQARQSLVSPEERLAVHERRQTTVYCTRCGEEHCTLHEATLNYCRSCGAEL